MNVARYDPFDLFEGVVKSVLRPGFDAAMEGRRNGWTGSMPFLGGWVIAIKPKYENGRFRKP